MNIKFSNGQNDLLNDCILATIKEIVAEIGSIKKIVLEKFSIKQPVFYLASIGKTCFHQ